MSNEKVCDVCGKPLSVCNTQAHSGGVSVTRLARGGEIKPMREILIAKSRVYLTSDKTKAVAEGDPDAAFLLVGKGGEIDRAVAEAYGVETEESVEIAIVTPGIEQEYNAMVALGGGSKSARNYDRMDLQRKIAKNLSNENPGQSGVANAQQAILTEGLVNKEMRKQKKGASRQNPEALRSVSAQGETNGEDSGEENQTGQAQDKPVNSKTKTLGKAPEKAPDIDPEKNLEKALRDAKKENRVE